MCCSNFVIFFFFLQKEKKSTLCRLISNPLREEVWTFIKLQVCDLLPKKNWDAVSFYKTEFNFVFTESRREPLLLQNVRFCPQEHNAFTTAGNWAPFSHFFTIFSFSLHVLAYCKTQIKKRKLMHKKFKWHLIMQNSFEEISHKWLLSSCKWLLSSIKRSRLLLRE